MENKIQDIEGLKHRFETCQKTLTAIGDETRQHLLFIMLECDCNGSRVVEIAEKTNLSRPAVSHHMQILKDAGLVKSRKEGTRIFYYLDPQDSTIERLICLFQGIKQIMEKVPDRSDDN